MALLDYLGPGRSPEALVEVAPLTMQDLGRLPERRPDERKPLDRIRHKHHALARALANGLSETEAGIVSGFTRPTISVLKGDPTFCDLIRFYQQESSKVFNHMQEALFGVSMLAIEELGRRLDPDEGEPDKIGVSALKEIVQMGADRTGNGPSTTQNVNVNIGLADRMAAAQKRLEATLVESRVAGTAKRTDVTYSEVD